MYLYHPLPRSRFSHTAMENKAHLLDIIDLQPTNKHSLAPEDPPGNIFSASEDTSASKIIG